MYRLSTFLAAFGVAGGLIYAAEALLFYAGTVLIACGMYTYLHMAEVLNVVLFTVSIGSQLMAFSACSSVVFHDMFTNIPLSVNEL
jgi:ATP-binding cassette subfamily B (MDR/TAP) protein 1